MVLITHVALQGAGKFLVQWPQRMQIVKLENSMSSDRWDCLGMEGQ